MNKTDNEQWIDIEWQEAENKAKTEANAKAMTKLNKVRPSVLPTAA